MTPTSTAKALLALRSVSATRFIAATAFVNVVLFHVPLYRYASEYLDVYRLHGQLTLLVLTAIVYVAAALPLTLLAAVLPVLLRPFCMLVAVANACALYFVVTYGVILDRTMMSSVLNTRGDEAFELLHPTLIFFVIVLGLLPALLLTRIRIAPVGRLRLVAQAALMVVSLLVLAYLNSSTWLWFDKHAKHLGGAIMPWSYVANAARARARELAAQVEPDLLPSVTASDGAKMLIVLVIGETARARNFSLYGYGRDTNPRLERANVAVLKGARSCSTYTTASLHCMLSHDGSTSGSWEPLPSYLQRSGVDVIWRSNNWGEPPLRVATYETASELRPSCRSDDCSFDNVLLSGLAERIDRSENDKVFVVLHTKGSHGPAYSTRYPDRFDVFEPVCRSVELNRCSEQSLLNAYDNTILATDDFLSQAIDMLAERSARPTMLMYASDHGESLGEFGLYLHGTPYSIAPDVQKDIPFLVWMSEGFSTATGASMAGLETPESHSHAQVFHSILGVFGLASPVYDERLDIFHR